MNPALIQQQQQQRHGCKLSLSLWGQQTWQEIRISDRKVIYKVSKKSGKNNINVEVPEANILYDHSYYILVTVISTIIIIIIIIGHMMFFYQYHHDNHDVIINTIDHRYYVYIYIPRIIMICHWGNTCSTWWWCKPSNPRPLLMGRQRMGRRINSCFSSNWDPSDRGKVTGTGGFIH